ncbi:hypothetical protein ACJRPK_11920 [Aquimarina sp. 2-A2]|uniref:hypothetical protein n=1 Tax=Aquimarina sp. 2-A2 TaxID=3382644 RepID=UPI00387EEE2E
MKKHLLFTCLMVCMGISTAVSQSIDKTAISDHMTHTVEVLELHDHDAASSFIKVAVLSSSRHLDITMSLHSILSSDGGFDFNCHGGFCMQKSHTHKKGLSQNKQLFTYFMNVSG